MYKFDEDGLKCPEGVCWVDGDPCQHRDSYHGCEHCNIRNEYRQKHRPLDEEDKHKIKPRKYKN